MWPSVAWCGCVWLCALAALASRVVTVRNNIIIIFRQDCFDLLSGEFVNRCDLQKVIMSEDWDEWEEQCVASIEAEPDFEQQFYNSKEHYTHQIWAEFHATASAIAQLYKGVLRHFLYYFFERSCL